MVLPLSKSQWRILIKLKINLSGDPTIPVLGICPISYAQIVYMLHRYLLSKVHCCPIHNSQEMEQAKWSSTDEWLMTMAMQYIYPLEYYLIVKKIGGGRKDFIG